MQSKRQPNDTKIGIASVSDLHAMANHNQSSLAGGTEGQHQQLSEAKQPSPFVARINVSQIDTTPTGANTTQTSLGGAGLGKTTLGFH